MLNIRLQNQLKRVKLSLYLWVGACYARDYLLLQLMHASRSVQFEGVSDKKIIADDATTIMNALFLTFTAVSGSRLAEESNQALMYAYHEPLRIPSVKEYSQMDFSDMPSDPRVAGRTLVFGLKPANPHLTMHNSKNHSPYIYISVI